MSAEDTYDLLNGSSSVPSLMNCCLRVISANINAIESLGDMPFALVKPILEDKRCTAEILRKIELNSPHLRKEDQEIWRKLCFDEYSECRDRYARGELEHVKSWRKFYMQCRLDREEKLNRAADRMREKRERDHAERRGRQLIVTDKVPPPKKAKFGSWGGPSKPKTLLEKARTQTKKATSVYRGPSTSSLSSCSMTSAQKALPRFSPPTAAGSPPKPMHTTHQSPNGVHKQLLRQHLASDVPSNTIANIPSPNGSELTTRSSLPSNTTASPRMLHPSYPKSGPSVSSLSRPTSMADFVAARFSNR